MSKRPNLDFVLLLALWATLLALALAGCATGPGRAPTALEQKFFDIQTNYTPQVQVHTVVQTNYVTATNFISQSVITPITQTNFVEIPMPVRRVIFSTNEVLTTNTVLATNMVPLYTLTPNQTAKDATAAVGVVGGLAGPYGGLAAGLLGGLFGLWGHLRSSKSNATSAVLAQVIETGSELMKSTPQGAVLADKWKTWMIAHQAEEGVLEQVTQIVGSAVDNGTAKDAAAKLTALAQSVRTA